MTLLPFSTFFAFAEGVHCVSIWVSFVLFFQTIEIIATYFLYEISCCRIKNANYVFAASYFNPKFNKHVGKKKRVPNDEVHEVYDPQLQKMRSILGCICVFGVCVSVCAL